MGMIGNQLAAGTALTVANDSFNGNGSTTAFTLSQTVSATTDIEVLVDNVQQSPYDSSYSVSGTTLTFSGAPAAGTNNIYVIYNASKHISTNQVIPDDASVTHSKLHTNATLPITRDMTNDRVGINATSPYKTLTVSKAFGGSAEDILDLQSTTSGGGTAPKVRFGTFAANSNTIGRIGFVDNPNYGGDFVVETNSSGSASDATTEKFRITKEGYVTKPNLPAFHAGLNSAANANASSYVTGYVLHADTGNHFNASTGIFTAPVAGKYFFSAFFMTNNSASTIDFSLHVNNTDYHYMVPYQASGNVPNYNHAGGSCIVALSANDTVRIRNNNTQLYGSSGNGRHSGFCGFFIG